MPKQSYEKEQVVEIISSVVKRIQNTRPADKKLLNEVELLKNSINQIHQEFHFVHPGKIQSEIPSAKNELDAVVETTEHATNEIMDACERIQGFIKDQPLEDSAPLENEIIRIIEACTFQDLTGQRIAKIIKSLKEIECRANALSEILEQNFSDQNYKPEMSSEEISLLNGPALPGQGISQEEIDKLLENF